MRKELEQLQIIEKYINGSLSSTDKMAFEKKLATDPALQNEVQLQRELMQGINRTAIKQTVKTGLKKHKFNKNLKNFGITGLAVVAIAAATFLFYNSIIKTKTNENSAQELPELNELGQNNWSDADKYLPSQQFQLNPEKDTVIETQDGIVLAVPAHSFLDANGKPATGTIHVEMKEALHAAEIMKAGLSTRSGDKLLETGGMFYINAHQGNASLKIDPNNALYAEIPTNDVKPNMQLFEGKRLPDGTIDWVNPKPIEKNLIPVDILSLNFYPPNYLDSLKSWGYNTKDKAFTDSLYYSFASMFLTPEQERARQDSISGFEAKAAAAVSEAQIKGATKAQLKIIAANYGLDYDGFAFSGSDSGGSIRGVNPSKIKAIWNEQFQNTLLATREFEERLPFIHRTCYDEVLNLYVNNLDKNLSAIDSMVIVMSGKTEYNFLDDVLKTEFLKFAARHDGKVKNGNKNVQLLKKYYEEKSKLFTAVINKTKEEFWKKNSEADIAATEKINDHEVKDTKRLFENYQKEFDLNLREAYHQLGYGDPAKTTILPAPVPPKAYGTPITSTGWCNIDSYTADATVNRTTIDYTDKQTGKKVLIKYEPLSITITDFKKYDRVLVYLLPDELNSFMRVENKDEVFEEKLDELMTYKLVCIAYKGEESFYYSQDNVKPGNLAVSLIKTTNFDIQNNVNKLSNRNQSTAMNEELNYMEFEKQETKRKAQLMKIEEFTNKTAHVIFPCMAEAAPATPGPADNSLKGGKNHMVSGISK